MLARSLINANNQQPVHLFENSLNQHLSITGQTGSGKTTSTVALLSDLQRANQAAFILDPTGEYQHLPNASVYRLGDNCYLSAGRLTVDQLLFALGLPATSEWQMTLADAIAGLRVAHNLLGLTSTLKKVGRERRQWQDEVRSLGNWGRDYDVDLLPEQLIEEMIMPDPDLPQHHLLGQVYDTDRIHDHWAIINHLRTQLATSRFQKLFGNGSTSPAYELTYVLKLFLNQSMQHQSLVLDLSLLQGQGRLQQLLVSLICQTILRLRLSAQTSFPVTVVIDEAHRYLPNDDAKLTDNGIFRILREGRKVNLSMLLTTQSPLDLVPRLRSQFANVLLHRLAEPVESRLWPGLDWSTIANQAIGQATYFSAGRSIPVKVTEPQWWQKEHSV
ncbi:ATP-binding protein [Limosilactobacillus secaliphilus]|uniref:ATP-binding protein n=1 Tax=Limosilactobacillus secaliphilus TaxID=396268 RepID=UPI00070F62C8|nr:ATP-binding protein [Limosilactobacillus secaliphilus]